MAIDLHTYAELTEQRDRFIRTIDSIEYTITRITDDPETKEPRYHLASMPFGRFLFTITMDVRFLKIEANGITTVTIDQTTCPKLVGRIWEANEAYEENLARLRVHYQTEALRQLIERMTR